MRRTRARPLGCCGRNLLRAKYRPIAIFKRILVSHYGNGDVVVVIDMAVVPIGTQIRDEVILICL